MTYVKTYLSVLKKHVENLKCDVKDWSHGLQQFAVNSDLKLSNNNPAQFEYPRQTHILEKIYVVTLLQEELCPYVIDKNSSHVNKCVYL